MPPYRIRDARKSDIAFVVTTFVASFAEACPVTGAGSGMWPAEGRRVLEGLESEGSVLRVAAYAGDDETLAGWVLGNPRTRTLDYVYVRSELRRHATPGSTIARELVESLGKLERCTFKPPKGRVRIPHGWTFAPRFTIGWVSP